MYSCKVGTNFKIGFFDKFLNFCYDKESGFLYADELKTFEKLRVEKKLIAEAYIKSHETSEITELEQSVKSLGLKCESNIDNINELKNKVEKLEKENVVLEQTIKNLVEYQKDILTQQEETEQQQEEINKTLKNSIAILNKKIKDSNESIENLGIRFEAILEIISEQIANSKQTVNLLGPGITVEKIWNSMENKEAAAILAIMHMIKKTLEDKGTRF